MIKERYLLVKFGKREYLEDLKKGRIFFNAVKKTTPTRAVSSTPRFYYPTTPRRICEQGGFVERG